MLTKQQKKEISMMGCLREDTGFTEEEQIDYIKNGLMGAINEKTIEKLWPDAVPGVRKHGVLEYFLYYHNLKKVNVEPCIAFPGKITGKCDSKYVIERIDGKTLETDSEAYPNIRVLDEAKLKIGAYVILHRYKIRLVLSEKRNKEAIEIFNKYLRKRIVSD